MKIGGSIHRVWKAFALAASALVSISLVAAEPPTNTNFAHAAVLIGDYHEVTARLGDVVVDPEEEIAERELWWKWTAPGSGRISLGNAPQAARPENRAETIREAWPEPSYDHPQGVSSNAVVEVRNSVWVGPGNTTGGNTSIVFHPPPPTWFFSIYAVDGEGSLAEIDEFIWNSIQGFSDGPLTDSFAVTEGKTYAIRLVSYGGALPFSARFHSAPANDGFANRTSMRGVETEASGSTFGASTEPGEWADGRTVWWSWNPPANGVLAASVTGQRMWLDAFTGDSMGALTNLGASDKALELPVRLDVPIHFRVQGDYDDLGHDYTLKLRLDPLPPTINALKSGRLNDGAFQLRAEQLRGRETILFASTNLTEWNPWRPIWRGVVNGDGVTFRDLDATNSAQVFYSIRLAPPKTDEAQ